MELKCKWK